MKSQITTIEAAFEAEGLDINLMPEVSNLQRERYQKRTIANFKLDVVIDALNNEGQEKPWEPDYSNHKQLKWENAYCFVPGSGWSLDDVDNWRTYACCGSRRNFRERYIGEHLWEHFSDLIKETL